MNKIWLTSDAPGVVSWTSEKRDAADVEYIRSDLVDKLIEQIEHNESCASLKSYYVASIDDTIYPDCTCGLDDLIREMRG